MARDEARRIGLVMLGALVGAAALGLGAVLARLAGGARELVTPPPPHRSGRLLTIAEGEVVLSRTPETVLPGRYGMWTDDDRGYAKVGQVLRVDARSVTRELIDVEETPWAPGLVVRMGAAYHRSPAELGVPVADVQVRTPLGPAPAWRIPPAPDSEDGVWAILVHGRDAGRWECIRAVPALRAAGCTSLIVSYRNDPGAPRSPDGRYHLGLREWYDVEAAIAFAQSQGATRIVLMGWSMGGGIVLQTLRRSPLADLVDRVILDSPALDWRAVIGRTLEQRRVPAVLHPAFLAMLSTEVGARRIGLDEPIDLDELDQIRAAATFDVPILVLHSTADDVAPIESARRLRDARPDLVTLVEFDGAGHVRLWNREQERYETAISDWLREHPGRLPAQSADSRTQRA